MTSVSHAVLIGLLVVACGCSHEGDSTAPTSDASTTTTTSATTSTDLAIENDFGLVADALGQARTRWVEVGLSRYQLIVTESRNYWSKGCVWISDVSDGTVVETTMGSGSPDRCIERDWTVEKLHDMVSSMLNDTRTFSARRFGQHHLDVTFDASGVPVMIGFDLANGDDEETSIQVMFTEQP